MSHPEVLLRDEDAPVERTYHCSPSMYGFHTSPAEVRGIMGPFGSGKSVACVMEIIRRAKEQAKGRDGKRRTGGRSIRNTYGELRDTTIRTFHDWVPHTGIRAPRRFVQTPEPTYHITEGDLDIEILFRALDKPQQVKKLLSLELTGAWVNEAREVPLAIIEGLQGRCGRYPSFREEGCTWSGLIMDTNPPDNDHPWYKMFEETRPSNWALFRQPSGGRRRPRTSRISSPATTPAWRSANGPIGSASISTGSTASSSKASRSGRNITTASIAAHRAAALRSQAAAAGGAGFRADAGGDLRPARRQGPLAHPRGADRRRHRHPALRRGDARLHCREVSGHRPAGRQGVGRPGRSDPAQTDERTCFQILQSQGYRPEKAPTQNFTTRREAVAAPLNRMVDGEPGFLLSPSCPVLRKAMQGGYAYKRVAVAGEERFKDEPDKNRFSHPADALEYLCCGGGEAHELVRKKQPDPPRWDPVAAAKKQGYGKKGGSTWMGRG
jgi:hypothetical protein